MIIVALTMVKYKTVLTLVHENKTRRIWQKQLRIPAYDGLNSFLGRTRFAYSEKTISYNAKIVTHMKLFF